MSVRIIKDSDFGGGTPVGTPVDAEIGDGVIPIDVLPYCDDCEAISYLPHILCDGEVDWCCSIPTEANTGSDSCGNLKYCTPVSDGQCLSFQFMIQNTRNAPNSLSWAQFLQNQGITHGWFNSVTNPSNYTCKVRIFRADGTQIADAVVDALIRSASVYLKRDELASPGFPFQAWYNWHQQIEICIPDMSTLADEFYFEFEFLPFGWTTGAGTKYRSQRYCYAQCDIDCRDRVVCIEGVYPDRDCDGLNYLPVPPTINFNKYKGTETPPQILWARSMFNNFSTHTHRVCIPAVFRLSDAQIEREIPDTECTPVSITAWKSYELHGNKQIPPYEAQNIMKAFTAPVVIIEGVQVNPNGLRKGDGVGDMFSINETLTGCPCVQDNGCF
jgi:hypothetical protein